MATAVKETGIVSMKADVLTRVRAARVPGAGAVGGTVQVLIRFIGLGLGPDTDVGQVPTVNLRGRHT